MKNKRKFLYIALGVIVLATIVSVKNSSFLQGKMFRFDEKRILDTQQIDLKKSSQKTRLDNSILESVLEEQTTKSTLQDIWGARAINKIPTDIQDCPTSDLEPEVFYADTLKSEDLQILKKYKKSNVEIIVISPKNVSTIAPEIKGGFVLIDTWLDWVTKNIHSYPCNRIVIFTHENYAAGGPEQLGIGGFGGVNNYWLVWHELTHSYFNSQSTEAVWLIEGPSTAMPTIMIQNLINKIKWNDKDFPYVPDVEIDGINNQFKNLTTEGWSDYKSGKIYLEKNACNLNPPSQSGDQDYKDNSNWGRVFILDLAIQFGSETIIDTLSTIYAKYRYTGLEKITDKDFYDAFLYLVAKNNKTAVNKYDKAKNLLKEKLCL